MENKDYKSRLKEYVLQDIVYKEYKEKNIELNDFEKFCVSHCEDIESLLNENKELKEKIDGIYEERTHLYNKLSLKKGELNRKLILQKKFAKYLENNIKKYEDKLEKCPSMAGMLKLPISFWKDELKKYEEIIGVSK